MGNHQRDADGMNNGCTMLAEVEKPFPREGESAYWRPVGVQEKEIEPCPRRTER
jgi:hypothetical protein